MNQLKDDILLEKIVKRDEWRELRKALQAILVNGQDVDNRLAF